MTALSAGDLDEQNIASIEDLVGAIPGISLRTAGPGQTEYEMRGLASSGGSVATVGFYLDETPLSASAVALNGRTVIDADLYDLNRTEVLRGPQGTLYGAGSMGGTIKLVTNPPKLDDLGRVCLRRRLANHRRQHQRPRQPDAEFADRRHSGAALRHDGQVHQRLDPSLCDRARAVSLSDEFRQLRGLLLHPRQCGGRAHCRGPRELQHRALHFLARVLAGSAGREFVHHRQLHVSAHRCRRIQQFSGATQQRGDLPALRYQGAVLRFIPSVEPEDRLRHVLREPDVGIVLLEARCIPIDGFD